MSRAPEVGRDPPAHDARRPGRAARRRRGDVPQGAGLAGVLRRRAVPPPRDRARLPPPGVRADGVRRARRRSSRRGSEGRTGFPIVDAGMRQLRATGWMHNRVRMIVASFLVKDLHLEWQHGARHFMHWLVDGDLASNQHGWQWTAGCGTDAAPYFRVFNPITQGRKFDPDGDYVRRWVPELRRRRRPARAAPHGYPTRSWTTPRSAARRWTAGRGSGDDRPAGARAASAGRRSSGNGGWTAGALAALVPRTARTTTGAVAGRSRSPCAAAPAGHADGRRRPTATPSRGRRLDRGRRARSRRPEL